MGSYNQQVPYRLIVGTLFHIFTISATKWQVRFVDCSLIYSDFQRLFVCKTFEFGANFGPRWFSLGFEFETIYGTFCKKINNLTKNRVSCFGWVGKIMRWSENYQPVHSISAPNWFMGCLDRVTYTKSKSSKPKE